MMFFAEDEFVLLHGFHQDRMDHCVTRARISFNSGAAENTYLTLAFTTLGFLTIDHDSTQVPRIGQCKQTYVALTSTRDQDRPAFRSLQIRMASPLGWYRVQLSLPRFLYCAREASVSWFSGSHTSHSSMSRIPISSQCQMGSTANATPNSFRDT